MTIVVGIDPSSYKIAFAFGSILTEYTAGEYQIGNERRRDPIEYRCYQAARAARDLLNEIRANSDDPVRVYIEEPVMGVGVKATILQAKVHGAFVSALYDRAVISTVNVQVWKREVIGWGNATKGDVVKWTQRLGQRLPNQDQRDAYAIYAYGLKTLGVADRITADLAPQET